MPDSKHDKWIDVLSMSPPIYNQHDAASDLPDKLQDGPGEPTAALLLPAVQAAREAARGAEKTVDSFEFVELGVPEDETHTAVMPADNLVSGVYMGGSPADPAVEDPLPDMTAGDTAFADGLDFL